MLKERVWLSLQCRRNVLILILMEHAQRVINHIQKNRLSKVLILILMEHAQRVKPGDLEVNFQEVLILILMEHAQRGWTPSR